MYCYLILDFFWVFNKQNFFSTSITSLNQYLYFHIQFLLYFMCQYFLIGLSVCFIVSWGIFFRFKKLFSCATTRFVLSTPFRSGNCKNINFTWSVCQISCQTGIQCLPNWLLISIKLKYLPSLNQNYVLNQWQIINSSFSSQQTLFSRNYFVKQSAPTSNRTDFSNI